MALTHLRQSFEQAMAADKPVIEQKVPRGQMTPTLKPEVGHIKFTGHRLDAERPEEGQ